MNTYVFLFHVTSFIVVTAVVVAAHEFFHWLPAKLFGFAPTINVSRVWRPQISYENNGEYGKILVTTILPTILLVVIGFLLPSEGYVAVLYGKLLCLSHIVNFLPLTTDGQVFLLALARLCGFLPEEGPRP